jgi:formylglycine-generating enzyme required for sulfatase activity
MKRFFSLFLAALFLTGCKNVFVDNILGNQDNKLASARIYTVSVDPSTHGTIAARPSSGRAGTEVVIMVSPEAGHRLQKGSLKYHGNKGDTAIDETTRTFRLPAQDVRVSAEFEPLPAENFTISVKIDDLDHGAIVAQPEFGRQGDPIYLALIPEPGYRYKLGSLKYNDLPVDELTRTFLLPGKHVLVTAEFEPLPSAADYTIRVGVMQHGRVFAKPEFSPAGAEVYLQVIPDPGYILKEKSLKYTGSSGEETYITGRGRTFTMPADHITVAAEFEPVPAADDYTVSSENIKNGRIIPLPGYGKEKTQIYLHVIPDSGYTLKQNTLKIKGASVNRQVDEKSRIFEMPREHVRAAAEFELLPSGQYTVRVDVADQGHIFATPVFGKEGTVISLRLYPDVGYRLKSNTLRYITGAGQSVSIDEVAREFSLPADNVTVRAEFENIPQGNYIVFPGMTANGHISPSPESGPKGTEIFLWVTPDPGYKYKAGTLTFKEEKSTKEESIPDATRTFKLPASHVQVDADFEPVESGKYTIRINPTVHGRIYVNPGSAASGEAVSLTITPDPAYGLKKGSLKYTGADGVPTPIIGESFTMPGKHITIYAEFESVERRVYIDKNLSGGKIKVTPEKAYPGAVISLVVTPSNGNKYEAGSLKYQDSDRREKIINEKTLQFSMPNDNITVTAQFKPFAAVQNLKVNDKPLNLIAGKTDYTLWIPSQDEKAVFTFDTTDGMKTEPKSGTEHSLKLFENDPVRYTIKNPDGITITTYTFRMIRELVPTEEVPAGKFTLDTDGAKVMNITRAFRMGKYELTQAEWKRVMNYGRGSDGDNFPARDIIWYEAVIFCNKLSMLEKKTPVYSIDGQTDPKSWGTVPSNASAPQWDITVNWDANGYRLPTETEWLWAAMGAANGQSGTNTSGARYSYAGYPSVKLTEDAAWFSKNSKNKCQPTGAKQPNSLDLYDMSGNIAEWCWDWYDGGSSYENFPSGNGDTDYTGPDKGSLRVIRGGFYGSSEWTMFFSFRGDSRVRPHRAPYATAKEVGMRLLCRD